MYIAQPPLLTSFLRKENFKVCFKQCVALKRTVITRTCSTFENYLKYLSVNTIAIKYDKRKRF